MATNNNVRELREEFNQAERQKVTLTGGGGPGNNDGMDARLTALETRLDTVLPTLATKSDLSQLSADMHKGFSDQLRWIVGTAFALGATAITVMTFVLNNAAPKASQTVQAPPVIINVPAQAPAPAPAAKP